MAASGAAGATTSAVGELLSDDELSLVEVEHETLLLAAAESEVLSDDEVLEQSVLEDVVAAAAGSVAGSVAVVVCAMVSTGAMPRAATKQPAAAIRAKDVMVSSLSVGGGHKDSTSIRRLFTCAECGK